MYLFELICCLPRESITAQNAPVLVEFFSQILIQWEQNLEYQDLLHPTEQLKCIIHLSHLRDENVIRNSVISKIGKHSISPAELTLVVHWCAEDFKLLLSCAQYLGDNWKNNDLCIHLFSKLIQRASSAKDLYPCLPSLFAWLQDTCTDYLQQRFYNPPAEFSSSLEYVDHLIVKFSKNQYTNLDERTLMQLLGKNWQGLLYHNILFRLSSTVEVREIRQCLQKWCGTVAYDTTETSTATEAVVCWDECAQLFLSDTRLVELINNSPKRVVVKLRTVTPEHIPPLASILERNLPNLIGIVIKAKQKKLFSQENLRTFVNALQNLDYLKVLCLRNVSLSKEAYLQLVTGLGTNHSIFRLDLGGMSLSNSLLDSAWDLVQNSSISSFGQYDKPSLREVIERFLSTY